MNRFFSLSSFVSCAKPAILLAILFGIILYLNTLFPPLADDLHWPFTKESVEGEIVCSDKRITSFSEVIQSCYNHRFMCMGNGRLANDLCIVLSSYFSKGVFNFLNSCAFICFVLLSTLLCFRKVSLHTLIITTAGLLLFLPSVPRTIFWMSGAVNYMWTACFALLFFILMETQSTSHYKYLPNWLHDNLHPLHQIAMYVTLLIACMFHEAMAVTLLSALTIYFTVNKTTVQHPRILIIFAIIGTTYSLFNPAILNRGLQNDASLFHQLRSNIIAILFLSFIPLGVFFLALIKSRVQYCTLKKDFSVYCALLYLCLAMCIAEQGSWGGSLFFLNLFLFVTSAKYLFCCEHRNGNISFKQIKLLIFVSVLICICRFALLCCEFNATQKITTDVIQKARTNTERIIHVDYPSFTRLPYLSAGLSQSCSLNSRHKQWIANFYGTQPFTAVIDVPLPPNVNLTELPEILPHENKGVRIDNTYVVRLPDADIYSVLIHSKTNVYKGSLKKELSPYLMFGYLYPKWMSIKRHYYDNSVYISFQTDKVIDSCEILMRRLPDNMNEIITVHF